MDPGARVPVRILLRPGVDGGGVIHLQREKSVGDTMVLGVLRDGEFMHKFLTLVERPDL